MNNSFIDALLAVTVAASFLFDGVLVAQTTPQQTKICEARHIAADACVNLANELSRKTLGGAASIQEIDLPQTYIQNFSQNLAPYAILATIRTGLNSEASEDLQSALQTLSTNGLVNQAGGAASSNGSTNLVTKPTTTDFLSMAAESGAFTDTLNGSTSTIHANALGLIKYFNELPIFMRSNVKGADEIQPLNFNVTLNVSQTGSTQAPSSGNANKTAPVNLATIFVPSNNASLSSFGVTYAIYRPFNPQSAKATAAWATAVSSAKATLQTNTELLRSTLSTLLPTAQVQDLFSDKALAPALGKWHSDAGAAERLSDPNAAFKALAKAYAIYVQAYCKALIAKPDGPANAMAYVKAVQSFEDSVYAVVNKARGTPLATIGYTYTPSAQKPGSHAFTTTVSYSFAGSATGESRSFLTGAQITGNFGVSIFANVPAGAVYGRLQDLQGSAEFDLPVGGTSTQSIGTFSVAGYGQYQYNPTVLNITSANVLPGTNITLPANAQSLLGTSGWLGIVQGKFVFNLKKGLSVPVAVKWSNKTDLLQANDVRGQVGISYDFSALSSLISSGTK
jgi:hypothetical protein